jgi:cell division protein FtsB
MAWREVDRVDRNGRGRPGTGARANRPESTRAARARSDAVRRVRVTRPVPRTRRGSANPLGLATTRRAAMVAIVVCALALSVAVPLRTYLAQRDEVHVQEQRKAELQAEVAELERRKALLEDPAQLEAEARRRLRYVRPGETPYIVELPSDHADAGSAEPEQPPVPPQSWYEVLWDQTSR